MKNINTKINISDIPRYLSGIIFVNVTDDKAYIFLNPNAKNKISRCIVDRLFGFEYPLPFEFYDDFIYDNY